jgi:outer membrane protein assembly factor BamD
MKAHNQDSGQTSGAPAARSRFLALAAAVLIGVTLSACSGKNSQKDTYIEGTVEDLYNRGTDLLLAQEYKEAAKFFNEVDRQHPYSSWAARAQLMAAYSYYKGGEFATATATVDRFIRLHPGHRDVAYAYYLRGLVQFDQIRDVKRDQTHTAKSLDGFQAVVRRFPNSKYARDARRKIVVLEDHLAARQLEIGRYYQRRKQHLAAINRFKVVVEKYQTTRQVPEALHRMAESYTALGVKPEARRMAAVLGYNYPASEWYVDSYELVENRRINRPPPKKPKSFFGRVIDFLF